MTYRFPFGQPLTAVEQTDRAPKRVFVVGVYASAVHARWIGTDGRTIIKALAVASEPYIFWRGENAAEIIDRVHLPPELGKLEPADDQFNGPSGKALDEQYLEPLGLRRKDAWLCDLVPHSCVNPAQREAIDRAYTPLAQLHRLPMPTIPCVPPQLADTERVRQIAAELHASQAQTLILLGDQPIRWFLRAFNLRWSRLSDFGTDSCSYGKLHPVVIENHPLNVLPLAHPRQVAKLGRSSATWYDLHRQWRSRRTAV